jgi:hypothetical protein
MEIRMNHRDALSAAIRHQQHADNMFRCTPEIARHKPHAVYIIINSPTVGIPCNVVWKIIVLYTIFLVINFRNQFMSQFNIIILNSKMCRTYPFERPLRSSGY